MNEKNIFLKDSNGESIRFLGTISKKIYSKKTNKLIGININNVTITDRFYLEDYNKLINRMQKDFVKQYKRKSQRSSLILFAPKIKNYQLDNINLYDINTQVTFTVSSRYDKEKDRDMFNANDLKIHYSKETENTNLVNSMNNGIICNKEYIPVEKLKLNDKKLHVLLDKIYSNSEFEDIMEVQSLINIWISKYMKQAKKDEYEKECRKIENEKKNELEKSEKSLQKVFENIKSVYRQCAI